MNEIRAATTGTASPSDEDYIRKFIANLEDETAMIHVNRVNGLGCYDTESWGGPSRQVLATALRKALER